MDVSSGFRLVTPSDTATELTDVPPVVTGAAESLADPVVVSVENFSPLSPETPAAFVEYEVDLSAVVDFADVAKRTVGSAVNEERLENKMSADFALDCAVLFADCVTSAGVMVDMGLGDVLFFQTVALSVASAYDEAWWATVSLTD